MAGVKPPKIGVARLNATEKPVVLFSGGIISARHGIIAPLLRPKRMDSHNSTIGRRTVEGLLTSHSIAGYEVTIAATEHKTALSRNSETRASVIGMWPGREKPVNGMPPCPALYNF